MGSYTCMPFSTILLPSCTLPQLRLIPYAAAACHPAHRLLPTHCLPLATAAPSHGFIHCAPACHQFSPSIPLITSYGLPHAASTLRTHFTGCIYAYRCPRHTRLCAYALPRAFGTSVAAAHSPFSRSQLRRAHPLRCLLARHHVFSPRRTALRTYHSRAFPFPGSFIPPLRYRVACWRARVRTAIPATSRPLSSLIFDCKHLQHTRLPATDGTTTHHTTHAWFGCFLPDVDGRGRRQRDAPSRSANARCDVRALRDELFSRVQNIIANIFLFCTDCCNSAFLLVPIRDAWTRL